jgi:hypothetical protein
MRYALAAALLLVVGTARSEQWLQRYHDAQHTSFINAAIDPLVAENFRYTFDPDQVPRDFGVYLIHYTDPKVEADGSILVPVIVRNGSVVLSNSVTKVSGGTAVWTFDSDWLRQPGSSWEPVFDFAVDPNAGTAGIVYVMGKYGCLWLINEPDGTIVGRKCATDPVDPTGENIWDVSPLTIDGNGNVFWTIRSTSSLIRSSIVKLDTSGNITASDLASLAGTNQIAATNASPAVSANNTILYVATALQGGSQGHLLALDLTDPTLTTVNWNTSLVAGFGCPAPIIHESGTSSPIALPDGAAIGGWAGSPSSEGAYYSFDSSGNPRGCYRFGWDDTMGQITLNGTNYLVGKHNHYTRTSSQCNNGIDPPVNPPCYEIVVLDSTTMVKQWSYIGTEINPSTGEPYEFCIDAPTLYKQTGPGGDVGYVVAPSEGGTLYNLRLFSNPPDYTSLPVGGPQNAAYVPTVSNGGSAYTINHGQVVGVGAQ